MTATATKPDTRPEMELLCLLSPTVPARIMDLAADMGMTCPELRSLVCDMRRVGDYPIRWDAGKLLLPQGNAARHALVYWESVHRE